MLFLWESLLSLVKTKRIKIITKRPCYIYGIRLLNRKGFRYIGQTIQPIEARIEAHIRESLKGTHKNKALAAFISKNCCYIHFEILEVCDISIANQREKSWIVKMKKEGHKLFNITDPTNSYRKLKK